MFMIRMLAAAGLAVVLSAGVHASDNPGDTLTHEKSQSLKRPHKSVPNALPEKDDEVLSGSAGSANPPARKIVARPTESLSPRTKDFQGGSDDGSSIRRKQEQHRPGAGVNKSVTPERKAALSPTESLSPRTKDFTGGSDDGQSIRRKQEQHRPGAGVNKSVMPERKTALSPTESLSPRTKGGIGGGAQAGLRSSPKSRTGLQTSTGDQPKLQLRSSPKSGTSQGDQPELQLQSSPKGGSPATQQYNPKEVGIDKSMPMKQGGHGKRK